MSILVREERIAKITKGVYPRAYANDENFQRPRIVGRNSAGRNRAEIGFRSVWKSIQLYLPLASREQARKFLFGLSKLRCWWQSIEIEISRACKEKKKKTKRKDTFHDIVCFNFRNSPLPLFSSRPHLFSPNTSQTLWFENDAIQFYRVEWIIRIILCYVRISFLHGGTQTISPSFISESENLFSFLESFFKVGRPRRIENFFE